MTYRVSDIERRNIAMYNKLLRLDCVLLQNYKDMNAVEWQSKPLLFRSVTGACPDFRMTPAAFLQLETLEHA